MTRDFNFTESEKIALNELIESVNQMDADAESPFILLARVYKTGQQNGYQQGFDAGKKEAAAHGA